MSNLTQFVGEDWNSLPGKPAVVAAGATQAAARAAIGAGTSNLALGSGAGDAMPGNTVIPAAVTWGTISGKPAVIAEGANAAAARSAIGAGTSNLALGATAGTALAGDTPVLPEAPSDGKIYGRKDAAWVEASSAGAGSGSGGAGLPDGGTLGQILAKASGTDQDVAWVDPPAGGGGGSSSINAVLGTHFINQQTTQTQFLVTPANLEAGAVYRMNATIMLRPTNTANGVTLGFSGSFGALLFLLRARYRGASGTDITRVCHDKSGTIVLPNHETSNDGNLLLIEGFIHAQTSGTLALTFAVNTAWDYCAVVKGSFLQLEPVGTASLA